MKKVIRKLEQKEIKLFTEIVSTAYPGIKLTTKQEKDSFIKRIGKILKESKNVQCFGIFDDKELIGGALYYKFRMNNRGEIIDMAGIGLVAISLLHKKEHAAKDLLSHFLNQFKDKKFRIASLYAFNPEFYKNMGFCFGTRFYRYQIKPASFTDYSMKSHLRYATFEDVRKIHECYEEFHRNNHGTCSKHKKSFEASFKSGEIKYLVYEENAKIKAYMIFSQKDISKENFLRQVLEIQRLIINEPRAYKEFSTFLHSQKDQVDRIIIDSHDFDFIHLLNDPRDASENILPVVAHQFATDNTAMMYRILEPKMFIEDILKIKKPEGRFDFTLKIKDTFIKKNNISLNIHISKNKSVVSMGKLSDFVIGIDILNLASWLMGVIDLRKLYSYGLIELDSKEKRKTKEIESMLADIQKTIGFDIHPICLTPF